MGKIEAAIGEFSSSPRCQEGSIIHYTFDGGIGVHHPFIGMCQGGANLWSRVL